MVKDRSICEECEKNNVKGYYFAADRCKKCDNYETFGTSDVTVILGEVEQNPVGVEIECSHCPNVISMSYGDFSDLMKSDFIGDWPGEILQCPKCKKKTMIFSVENSNGYAYKNKEKFK